MKKIVTILLLFVIIGCSDTQDSIDSLDLSNLNFAELNFGLHNKDITIPINLKQKKSVDEFSNQLIDEIDQLIVKNKAVYFELILFVDGRNNILKISTIHKKLKESTPYTRSVGDPIEDIMGSCQDGWTDEGNCSSADCVRTRVSAVLSRIDRNGDCQRVQVSRGWVSAKVCSQSCAN